MFGIKFFCNFHISRILNEKVSHKFLDNATCALKSPVQQERTGNHSLLRITSNVIFLSPFQVKRRTENNISQERNKEIARKFTKPYTTSALGTFFYQ